MLRKLVKAKQPKTARGDRPDLRQGQQPTEAKAKASAKAKIADNDQGDANVSKKFKKLKPILKGSDSKKNMDQMSFQITVDNTSEDKSRKELGSYRQSRQISCKPKKRNRNLTIASLIKKDLDTSEQNLSQTITPIGSAKRAMEDVNQEEKTLRRTNSQRGEFNAPDSTNFNFKLDQCLISNGTFELFTQDTTVKNGSGNSQGWLSTRQKDSTNTKQTFWKDQSVKLSSAKNEFGKCSTIESSLGSIHEARKKFKKRKSRSFGLNDQIQFEGQKSGTFGTNDQTKIDKQRFRYYQPTLSKGKHLKTKDKMLKYQTGQSKVYLDKPMLNTIMEDSPTKIIEASTMPNTPYDRVKKSLDAKLQQYDIPTKVRNVKQIMKTDIFKSQLFLKNKTASESKTQFKEKQSTLDKSKQINVARKSFIGQIEEDRSPRDFDFKSNASSSKSQPRSPFWSFKTRESIKPKDGVPNLFESGMGNEAPVKRLRSSVSAQKLNNLHGNLQRDYSGNMRCILSTDDNGSSSGPRAESWGRKKVNLNTLPSYKLNSYEKEFMTSSPDRHIFQSKMRKVDVTKPCQVELTLQNRNSFPAQSKGEGIKVFTVKDSLNNDMRQSVVSAHNMAQNYKTQVNRNYFHMTPRSLKSKDSVSSLLC